MRRTWRSQDINNKLNPYQLYMNLKKPSRSLHAHPKRKAHPVAHDVQNANQNIPLDRFPHIRKENIT